MAFSDAEKRTLLDTARQAIDHAIRTNTPWVVDVAVYPPALREKRATFVTLMLAGSLRGCMGTLEAVRPAIADVARNAYAAAFRDPRFTPLTAAEATNVSIELSILTEPQAITFTDEQNAIAQIRPGIDGLVLADTALHKRGTFLPAVWDTLPNVQDFWAHLKQKAGLSVDHWSATMKLWRYTAEKITESE